MKKTIILTLEMTLESFSPEKMKKYAANYQCSVDELVGLEDTQPIDIGEQAEFILSDSGYFFEGSSIHATLSEVKLISADYKQ
jgi:hypothetical protein